MTREEAIQKLKNFADHAYPNEEFLIAIKALEQEPKTGKYEYHTDHTDCLWYGSGGGCPVTCSQYRDGWNDAMEYIYKNGKGYQPYRRERESEG